MSNPTRQLNPTRDEFAALLARSLENDDVYEGSVVKGKVVGIEKDLAVIDVGLKMEGRVPTREFSPLAKDGGLKVGDTVEVYLERIENALGEAVLSRDKAKREESWTRLEKMFEANEKVNGVIFNKVKGGFTVDLDGAVAFLPGSQVDIRPVRDIGPLMHQRQPFRILKMDRRRGNIVVSRRSVLEETRSEQRADIVARLGEGQVIDGLVKNITDYGAFIDLGGIDGLLHVTDMDWRRVNHPSEILNVGDTVKVQIIRINPETQRISLGIKQLQSDPWQAIEAKYPIGAKFTGTVTNIADYGAFVELEPGVEGLIHVSEMSWTKKNVHPGKIVSTSQQVEVQVLEVDPNKRRISLGLKQTQDNPWDAFLTQHPKGSTVEGPIRNITEFGLFIGLDNGVDGMVHLSDLDWQKAGEEAIKDYKKGDNVNAIVLDVDSSKERILLGIKQLGGDRADTLAKYKKGDQVTCEVVAVQENGIEVKIADTEMTTFVKRSDLSRDRSEQRPERFTVGQKVDAAVATVDKAARRINVSIKQLEISEEKQAVAQYGSSDSGASLGDIFKAAIKKRASVETDDEQRSLRSLHDERKLVSSRHMPQISDSPVLRPSDAEGNVMSFDLSKTEAEALETETEIISGHIRSQLDKISSNIDDEHLSLIEKETWSKLSKRPSNHQLIELVMVIDGLADQVARADEVIIATSRLCHMYQKHNPSDPNFYFLLIKAGEVSEKIGKKFTSTTFLFEALKGAARADNFDAVARLKTKIDELTAVAR